MLERTRITIDLRQVHRRSGYEIDAAFARLEHHQIAATDERFARRKQLGHDFKIAALHLRHVENAVHDRKQVQSGLVDELGIFLTPRSVDHHLVFMDDHLRETDDGVQRRAQFVAHCREEARLRFPCPLGLISRGLERLLLKLAFGHVAHHCDDFNARLRMRP